MFFLGPAPSSLAPPALGTGGPCREDEPGYCRAPKQTASPPGHGAPYGAPPDTYRCSERAGSKYQARQISQGLCVLTAGRAGTGPRIPGASGVVPTFAGGLTSGHGFPGAFGCRDRWRVQEMAQGWLSGTKEAPPTSAVTPMGQKRKIASGPEWTYHGLLPMSLPPTEPNIQQKPLGA